jgi:hypothetical protein
MGPGLLFLSRDRVGMTAGDELSKLKSISNVGIYADTHHVLFERISGRNNIRDQTTFTKNR